MKGKSAVVKLAIHVHAKTRKTDSQSVGFSLNGTNLGVAKPHVANSTETKTGAESGFGTLINLFIFNNMAERKGFEISL
jgi:hypothetical protein